MSPEEMVKFAHGRPKLTSNGFVKKNPQYVVAVEDGQRPQGEYLAMYQISDYLDLTSCLPPVSVFQNLPEPTWLFYCF
jgi:hypothetical protein